MEPSHDLSSSPLYDESPDVASVTQIVSSGARDCVALFTTLSREDGWAEDQQRRFNVWASSIGVFARGHISLDHRLRDAPDILELIMQQVAVLKGNLSSLTETAQDQSAERLDDEGGVSSSHDLGLDRADSPASELLSGSESDEVPEYDAAHIVEETLTKLHKLSAAIRKSGNEYRDIRAEKYRELGETLDDGTFVDMTARFEEFAKKMIPHRIARRSNLDSGTSEPIAAKWLQERLAKTIARRRNRFWYWRKHQQRLGRSDWIATDSQLESTVDPLPALPNRIFKVYEKTGQKKNVAPTEDTRHTPINKDAFPKFLQSKRGSSATSASFFWKHEDKVPGPPDIDEAATHFTCPLCFILCEVKEARGKYWREHISRDLKPLICVFEYCKTPEKLFGSFREWISHMTQEQQEPQWHCVSAIHEEARIFSSPNEFKDHMRQEHTNSLSDSQLSKLSERSKRPALRLFLECPFCDFESTNPEASEYEVQDILQRHVASHLHSLALFSLPTLPDDGFTYDPSEETSERACDLDQRENLGSTLSSFATQSTRSDIVEDVGDDTTGDAPANEVGEVPIRRSENAERRFRPRSPPIHNSSEREDPVVDPGRNTYASVEERHVISRAASVDEPAEWNIGLDQRALVDTGLTNESGQQSPQVTQGDVESYTKRAGKQTDQSNLWSPAGELEYVWHTEESNTIEDAHATENPVEYMTADLQGTSFNDEQDAKKQTHITSINPYTDREEFDPHYKVHKSFEFKQGRVFKVLWSEPLTAGDAQGDGSSDHTTYTGELNKFGENSFLKVRRFVIIKPGAGYCICLPINTYERQGVAKSGVHATDHTIVYSGSKPIYFRGEKEKGLTRTPIKIVTKNPRHKLADTSRLNYAKTYSVEHNVKVWFIGNVDKDSMWHLISDFNSMHSQLGVQGLAELSPVRETLYTEGGMESRMEHQSHSAPVAQCSAHEETSIPEYAPTVGSPIEGMDRPRDADQHYSGSNPYYTSQDPYSESSESQTLQSSDSFDPRAESSTKESWSAWFENPEGGEYRSRIRSDGAYEYERRPTQVADPEDTHYSPEDEGNEDDDRGRSWEVFTV
ncbi:hypothetical protein EG329_009522 [Mollisiaceae sp. DMI_Dod_QoI]|nr:hypothetical protein EG329_009522 [Helotiales sp. DMI_Dod_QoI]